jgi:hypothetical protein
MVRPGRSGGCYARGSPCCHEPVSPKNQSPQDSQLTRTTKAPLPVPSDPRDVSRQDVGALMPSATKRRATVSYSSAVIPGLPETTKSR